MIQYDGAEGGKMRSVHLCVWGEWGEGGMRGERERQTPGCEEVKWFASATQK